MYQYIRPGFRCTWDAGEIQGCVIRKNKQPVDQYVGSVFLSNRPDGLVKIRIDRHASICEQVKNALLANRDGITKSKLYDVARKQYSAIVKTVVSELERDGTIVKVEEISKHSQGRFSTRYYHSEHYITDVDPCNSRWAIVLLSRIDGAKSGCKRRALSNFLDRGEQADRYQEALSHLITVGRVMPVKSKRQSNPGTTYYTPENVPQEHRELINA